MDVWEVAARVGNSFFLKKISFFIFFLIIFKLKKDTCQIYYRHISTKFAFLKRFGSLGAESKR
jgi:xylose isomerase